MTIMDRVAGRPRNGSISRAKLAGAIENRERTRRDRAAWRARGVELDEEEAARDREVDAARRRIIGENAAAWADRAAALRRRAERAGPEETVTLRRIRFMGTGEVISEPHLVFARDRYADLASAAQAHSDQLRAQSTNEALTGEHLVSSLGQLTEPPDEEG